MAYYHWTRTSQAIDELEFSELDHWWTYLQQQLLTPLDSFVSACLQFCL
jgi:hypothetical protein